MPAPERIKAVRDAAERWEKQLFDTTGRSRLRNYRDLRRSTLDLTPDNNNGLNPVALDQLLRGEKAKLTKLFPTFENDIDAFDDARRRFSAIHRKAREHLEEKGIATLFAAIGLATWEVETATVPNAPVILLPLKAEATGAATRDFSIAVSGDAHLNPVLTHILHRDHGINMDAAEEEMANMPLESFDDFRSLLDRLKTSWAALPQFVIKPRVVAAVFSYATMPLVSDLKANAEQFAANDLIAAIAGSGDARKALAGRICDPASNQPDSDPPADEFLVLDADSSQHMAINRVLGGESLVIQGPPGTGKSQTIANLITTLIARGKRVLFVAEKRAAIEAVTKRLNKAGLGDLVMDMPGGVTSRREFALALVASLKEVKNIPPQDYSELHKDLRQRRGALLAHGATVHEQREPWGLSLYEMEERLLRIPRDARVRLRLSANAARGLDKDKFRQLKGEIQEWVDRDGHTFAADHPEWFRSTIATSDEARKAFDLARDLEQTHLPDARDALFAALEKVDLARRPGTVAEWRRALEILLGIKQTLTRCEPAVYHLDHKALGAALAPAARFFVGRLLAPLFSKAYRSALQSLRETSRQPASIGAMDALAIVQGAEAQIEWWRTWNVGSDEPCAPDELDGVHERVATLSSALDNLGAIIKKNDLHDRTINDLVALLNKLTSSQQAVSRLPRLRELEARFRKGEVDIVLRRVGADILPKHAASAVEHAWLSRVLDDLKFDDQRLATFDADTHSRCRKEFIQLDRDHLSSTPWRIRRLVAETTVAAMDKFPDQTKTVEREATRKRGLSVRRLFAKASHVLSALHPCWTMSPVLAAEMIPADLDLFDVVVFDEASQIPPAEAIGCLARAPQAVIAGDSRQLPPTSFFGGGADDDGDGDDEDTLALTADIESLLDAAGVLLRDQMLEWHYRSRDDRLIAFSNNHIYGGGLTAFPGSLTDPPVEHCLIPFRPLPGVSGTRSNPDEAKKVVELVIAHARKRPRETLGVIAFGIHHANNIENVLQRRLSELNNRSLDDFFNESKAERFFVKNIERVQGDERDAIILSVGYHKDANGRLAYRFGPLNQEGGERRLNVAVTRARSRLTLVSSFSHHDMEPGRSDARGVELLRRYLEFAASGGENLGADVVEVPLNPFELSIADGLKRRGIPFTPQYGVSGYRIDFACAHPDQPGRMVLAIEADGASYHSLPTARDRDRLRQQVLEDKGWRFHRIWSTAWFRNREAELDKAEKAWREAVKSANAGTPPPVAEPPPVTEPPPTPSRGRRPKVRPKGTAGRNNITDYRNNELVALARWIESDGLLRTEEKLITEMREELGFRRGKRIERRLREAIGLARAH